MASLEALASILEPRMMTASYTQQKSAVCPFFDFYAANPSPMTGDRAEFIFVSANKEPSPMNVRGAPARPLQLVGMAERKVYFWRSFNFLDFNINSLQMLREPESPTLQSKGQAEIDRQLEVAANRDQIQRFLIFTKTMTDGAVYVDADGKILESSSGADIAVDFQVAAGHKNQLGGIIATAWDDPDAKILTQLDNLTMQAEAENQPRPRHVWLNTTAKRWIRDNTEIQDWLQGGGSTVRTEELLRGVDEIEINNFRFHFNHNTYTDASGATKAYLPATKAIITPDVGDWLINVNGSELVPRSTDLFGGESEALGNLEEFFGDFSYAELVHNPAALRIFMGQVYFYGFKDPNAIWQAVVDF